MGRTWGRDRSNASWGRTALRLIGDRVLKAINPRAIEAERVAFLNFFQAVNAPDVDLKALIEMDLNQVTLGRCIDMKSEDAAGVRSKMYKGRPGDDSAIEVNSHPYLDLMDAPCPDVPPALWRQKVYADLTAVGDYFGYISRDARGLPVSITRLRPDEITVNPDRTGARTIESYTWDTKEQGIIRVPGTSGNSGFLGMVGPIVIPWRDMFHVKTRHPFTDLRGYGGTQRLRHELLLDQAMRDFDYSRWAQGLPTEYLLFFNGKLQKGEREELLNTLRRKYKGPKGENFMLIESNDAGQAQFDVKPFPRHTEKEWAMLDKEQRLAYRICSSFGVPPSKLQDYSQSTRIANADAMERQYWEDAIRGLHVLLEDYCFSHFLPMNYGRGFFIQHDYRSVRALQQSAKEVADIHAIYLDRGVLTRNEARAQLGMDPIPLPAMDQPMIGSLVVGEQPAPPALPAPNDDDDDDMDMDMDDGKILKLTYRRKVILTEPLLDLEEEKEILDKLIRVKLKAIMQRAGDQQLELSGISGNFNVSDPAVLERIEIMSLRLSGDVIGKESELLRVAIAEGVADGLSVVDMRESIQASLAQAREPWQLDRIARTEVHQAQEGGGFEAAVQNGVEFKIWITARDSKVRGLDPDDEADHDGMEALGPIPMEARFIDTRSGAALMFPGDRDGARSGADTINCRCTWAADFSHLEGAARGGYRKSAKADVWYSKAERRSTFETDMRRTIKRYLIGAEKRALESYDAQTQRAADTGAVAAN